MISNQKTEVLKDLQCTSKRLHWRLQSSFLTVVYAIHRDPYSQSSGSPRRPKHRMDDQKNLNTRPLDE